MAIPTCSICLHTALAEIEEVLSAGGALIPTAARYGVSKSALGRHRQFCLAPKLAAAAKVMRSAKDVHAPVTRAKEIASGAVPTPQEALSLTALLERMERSLSRLEKSADAASADNLHMALSALSGQIARSVETAAKLQNIGYKDTGQVQQGEKFSVNIVLPSVERQRELGLNLSPTIDCTPERGSEAPQVTSRKRFAVGFDVDQDQD